MARLLTPEAPPTALLPAITDSLVLPHTLGARAVGMVEFADRAHQNAHYFDMTGTPDQSAAAHAQFEGSRQQTLEMLSEVRSRIASAPESPETDSYLREVFGRAFEHAKNHGAPHTSVRQWLADSEQGATNSQLYAFSARHVEYIARQPQSPEVTAVVKRAKTTYRGATEYAINTGLYVPEARDTLQKVRDAKVLSGDFWDTYVMQGFLGYHFADTDYLVLGQNTIQGQRAKPIILHELGHVQFYSEHLKAGLPSHFLEAMTEHAALSGERGWWHIINPYERCVNRADSDIYIPERAFIAMVISEGKEKIEPELPIRAYSAPARHPALADYMNAVRRSWGVDVHHWAQPRVEQYQRELENAGYDRHDARKWAFERVKTEMRNGEHLRSSQTKAGARRVTRK